MSPRTLPPVYACSGCLSVAQAANCLAVDLDRVGRAEMSYISSVGGGVRAFIKAARSRRPILAPDGCALAYVRACLTTVGVAPDVHLVLNQCGAKKRHHADCGDGGLSATAALVDDAVNTLKHRPDTAGG